VEEEYPVYRHPHPPEHYSPFLLLLTYDERQTLMNLFAGRATLLSTYEDGEGSGVMDSESGEWVDFAESPNPRAGAVIAALAAGFMRGHIP
jgi:hypothetical protein